MCDSPPPPPAVGAAPRERFAPVAAALVGDLCLLNGQVLKRTADKLDIALWAPGDLIAQLEPAARPQGRFIFAVPAGAAAGVVQRVEKRSAEARRNHQADVRARQTARANQAPPSDDEDEDGEEEPVGYRSVDVR